MIFPVNIKLFEEELEESIDRLLDIAIDKSIDDVLEKAGSGPEMMHLTVPKIVTARNEISSKIQKGELVEIDIDGVVLMTEIESIQEDDIGDQFGLQLELMNDE